MRKMVDAFPYLLRSSLAEEAGYRLAYIRSDFA